MNRTAIIAKIEEIAGRVGQPEGIEILEVELKGAGKHQVLQLVIDKPTGVTHGDCELISRQVGEILDAEDIVKGVYSLEVSSPGVERKLTRWKDWERFVGEKAKVVLKEPVESHPVKHFDGSIALANPETQTIAVDLADGARVTFPFDQVDRANLKFEW